MKQISILIVSLVISSSCFAVDTNSVTERTNVPANTSDWTGPYWGLSGGGAQTISRDVITTETLGTKFLNRNPYGSLSSGSGFGGLQAGYNWQRNNLVWGIEGDIQSGVSDSTSGRAHIGGGTFYDLATSSKIKWFGTARLRAGYAFNKHLSTLQVVSPLVIRGTHKIFRITLNTMLIILSRRLE